MQNEMEDRFAGLKRTGPVAFQRGGTPLGLRFMSGWSLGRGRRKSSKDKKRNDQWQTKRHGLHARPPYEAFRMVDDSQRKRVGMVTSGEGRGSEVGSESVVKGLGRNLESWDKKAARRSVPLKTAKSRLRRIRPGYFPCFAYQSALIGVKLFHFSGRSSSAKIAVTGQTGTQAPQSMHSVGWMYSCVSPSNAGSSLRG